MKKIAVIFHKFEPDSEGISISIQRLLYNMAKNCEMHLIAGKPSKNKIDFLKTEISTHIKDNIFFHSIPINENIGSEDYIWGLENLLYAIKKLHKTYGFDVLHAYYLTPSGFIATVASKLLKIPCLVGVRGNDIARDFLDYKQFHWIEWTLKNADYLTFLNQELLETANAIYPIKNKARVVLNSAYFPGAKIKRKTKNKNIILGYIGEVKRKKGLIYLLKALENLKNEGVELHITGYVYPDEKKAYLHFIEKNGLKNKVKFSSTVPHERIAEKFNECDVIVLPTISDGCPNVIFEAMALGKAIIGSDNPAISQVLENNKTGILVEQRNSDALANAIKRIIRNPEIISKLGDRAKAALKRFSPDNEINSYLEIYNKLAGRK